jgi:hypothetical protein
MAQVTSIRPETTCCHQNISKLSYLQATLQRDSHVLVILGSSNERITHKQTEVGWVHTLIIPAIGRAWPCLAPYRVVIIKKMYWVMFYFSPPRCVVRCWLSPWSFNFTRHALPSSGHWELGRQMPQIHMRMVSSWLSSSSFCFQFLLAASQ